MSIYYTLLTDTGAAKYAYNDANVLPTEFTEIALGDNNGNFFTPQVTDGDCVNEVYRANINSLTIDPVDDTTIIIELVIPANIGGFTIREARIYDADGIVIYTANTEAIPKPILSEGMANDLRLQFRVTRANTSQVTLLVDPSITLASQTYVINAITTHNNDPNAHGAAAWATKVGVQNQSYSYAVAGGTTTDYTVSLTPARTELTDGMRFVIDTTAVGSNTTTTPTVNVNGLGAKTVKRQNGAAVLVGDMPLMSELIYDATNTSFILLNPKQLQGELPLGSLDYPTIANSTNKITVTASSATNGGRVSIPANVLISLGEEIYSGETGAMRNVKTASWQSADLAVSSTYYLRAKFVEGVFTVYTQKGTDSDTIPASLMGTIDGASGGGFDSTVLDILIAKVVTSTAGTVPTVTALANAKNLISKSTVSLIVTKLPGESPVGWKSDVASTVTLNFARKIQPIIFQKGLRNNIFDIADTNQSIEANSYPMWWAIEIDTYSRYAVTAKYFYLDTTGAFGNIFFGYLLYG